MSSKTTSPPTPVQSILAGGAAGGVESLVTYPTEYVKTRMQLMAGGQSSISQLRVLFQTLKNDGIGRIYTGASAFCISNASKSGVRFFTFDLVKSKLPKDPNTGKSTALNNMIAGAFAGVAEAVTVVTPGESIKTRLVEDRTRGVTSTFTVIRSIASTSGIRGFYRGVLPVTMKQSANAVVRFTSYHAIFSAVQGIFGNLTAPIAGACAGIVTVYATMPFDTVKTKMQSSSGNSRQGTLHFVVKAVREDGIQGLWRGTTPRLVRLSVSGALSFSIYEYVLSALRRPQTQHAQAIIL